LAQSLYVDLLENPNAPAQPMHLGFRAGRNFALRFLEALRTVGVNHVAFNFKYSARAKSDLLEEIGQEILPKVAARKEGSSSRAA
jgi:hypothetical protein